MSRILLLALLALTACQSPHNYTKDQIERALYEGVKP